MQTIKKVVVLGAGSAGFLTAVSLKRLNPNLDVQVVRSAKIPVIGVGESTTAFIPQFLHQQIGIDVVKFFATVRPSWKLGIRFEWGPADGSHFNYPFDNYLEVGRPLLSKSSSYHCLDTLEDAGHFCKLMDSGRSPCSRYPDGKITVNPNVGYHIENRGFLQFLETTANEDGVSVLTGDVVSVKRKESGDVDSLIMEDGSEITADLYFDCSGFRSLLLAEEMGAKFVSYSDSLFCDTAIVGSWSRDDHINPYTIAETMDHGWCWRIDFEDHVTRGYVYSSQSCDEETARSEMKSKNPELGDDLKRVSFRSGRYDRYWIGNVIGIGNASGFVEPLEATALHLILEQVWGASKVLQDCNYRPIPKMVELENKRYRSVWDEVRDFLALHYKFNKRSDSEFWRHCRNDTPLKDAQPLVDFYRHAGPSAMCNGFIPGGSLFGFTGYLTMLIGQQVETEFDNQITPEQRAEWKKYQARMDQDLAYTLPVREGLGLVNPPRT